MKASTSLEMELFLRGKELQHLADAFDPLSLGQVLMDELEGIQPHVSLETYAVLKGVTAVLLRRGAEDAFSGLFEAKAKTVIGNKPNRQSFLRLVDGGRKP